MNAKNPSVPRSPWMFVGKYEEDSTAVAPPKIIIEPSFKTSESIFYFQPRNYTNI